MSVERLLVKKVKFFFKESYIKQRKLLTGPSTKNTTTFKKYAFTQQTYYIVAADATAE